jgi:adenosylcobinamide-GDP ribazoletransferase
LRALLAFFTVLPVGISGSSLEDAARRAYLLPLVGLLAGLPGAGLLLLAFVAPPGVAATLALGAALLADVGDALMVRGSRARRREVLKDSRTGAGAVGALFVVYGPSLAALTAFAVNSPERAAVALLACEVAARSAMLLLLVFGKPATDSSSSAYFVRALKEGKSRVAALILALALPSLVALSLGPSALLVTLVVLVATVLFALALARRAFGGISGDVSGATGELARAVLLIALSMVVS